MGGGLPNTPTKPLISGAGMLWSGELAWVLAMGHGQGSLLQRADGQWAEPTAAALFSRDRCKETGMEVQRPGLASLCWAVSPELEKFETGRSQEESPTAVRERVVTRAQASCAQG